MPASESAPESGELDVQLDGYERRIGRYGHELADALIAAAGVRRGQRVLDVGCGPGALTERLVALLGPDGVAALDPDPDAVRRCATRLPDVDVRVGSVESPRYGGAPSSTSSSVSSSSRSLPPPSAACKKWVYGT